MYICYNCGKKIDLKRLEEQEVFCPNCSGKVFFKETPTITKEVSAD